MPLQQIRDIPMHMIWKWNTSVTVDSHGILASLLKLELYDMVAVGVCTLCFNYLCQLVVLY